MAPVQSRLSSAVIVSGRIIDVNSKRYTVSIATEYAKKPQTDIPYATPYQHYADGEGIYFMPEIGSLCWVCFPSDGSLPFVLSWASASTTGEADFKSGKRDLNPGDIFLGTRDSNFLILRRGGVVQIGGGPLAQRMFLPINNTIKDFCENYGLHTLGGDLEWTIKREESTTDGKRPASLKLSAKEYATDSGSVAQLEIGSHDGSGDTILSLIINASGDEDAAKKISLQLTKDGKVLWDVADNVEWEVGGNFNVSATGDIELNSSTGSVHFIATTTATLEGTASSTVKSNGFVTLQAPLIKSEGLTMVGKSPVKFPVMMATPDFVTWIVTHVHPIIVPAPGFNTGPGLIGPPGLTGGSPFVPAPAISKMFLTE